MKTPFLLALVLLSACTKEITKVSSTSDTTPISPTNKVPEFIKYHIAQGQQYCDQSTYFPTNFTTLNFVVKFDSSAIYQNIDPVNQLDINKLFGFSDNNADHHLFSARFGWRWSDHALRLFGYTYNNGVRDSHELGTVVIGAENKCSIKVAPDKYIFNLNGSIDSMARESTTPTAIGYKLFPYFGGDELAPHDINIWIKETGE